MLAQALKMPNAAPNWRLISPEAIAMSRAACGFVAARTELTWLTNWLRSWPAGSCFTQLAAACASLPAHAETKALMADSRSCLLGMDCTYANAACKSVSAQREINV